MNEKNENAYIPTYTMDATVGGIGAFVRLHKEYIWKIWFPLVPFLILAMLADTVISSLYYSDDEVGFNLFGSVAGVVCYAIFAILWHRLVIMGEKGYKKVNLRNLSHGEKCFIGLVFLVHITFTVFSFLWIMALEAISPDATIYILTAALAFLAVVTFLSYGFYRISFVYPAWAVGRKMSFSDSIRLSRGTFWRSGFSAFFASFKVLLVYMFIMIVLSITWYALLMIMSQEGGLVRSQEGGHIVNFLFYLPLVIYFQPIFTAIGVTALTNYYLYALEQQEKGAPVDDNAN